MKLEKKESIRYYNDQPYKYLYFIDQSTKKLHGIDIDENTDYIKDKRYWVCNQEVGHDVWDGDRHYWI